MGSQHLILTGLVISLVAACAPNEVVWEVQGPGGGLAHAASTDRAMSFTEPAILVDTSGGLPKAPSIVIHDGLLVVTWIDGGGGRIAAWTAPGLGSAGLETPLEYDR